MNNPIEVQQDLLVKLLDKAKKTEYGKKYEFESMASYDTFSQRVPVAGYEDLFPYIDRLLKGEQNILWPTETKWFSKSSGTTSQRSKFIPVPPEAIDDCHYKGGKDMLAIYINNYPDTKIFTGKALGIGGSHQQNPMNKNGKSHFGDVSAVLMEHLPWWAEWQRTPSLDIALMDDWEVKIDKMAKVTAKENVTSLSGVPTWMLVLLQRILDNTGKENLLEVWPNLEVFMHGAVAFQPYRPIFEKLIPGSQMRYVDTYNASEGFFGIQDQVDSDEMLLMLDYGIFYEFIPMEQWGQPNPQVIPLEQVQTGKNYAMVITTNAGLWRYLIGDTVRFTNTSPYRIKISGRTKHFINAFGEEVIIENAEKAISAACQATGAIIDNFTAGPRYLDGKTKGCHEWVIEFQNPPGSLEQFTQLLDSTLREINSDYDAKRYKDIALTQPSIVAVPAGTFYEWMKKRGKLGGQNKVPRLSNDRTYLDDILEMVQQTTN